MRQGNFCEEDILAIVGEIGSRKVKRYTVMANNTISSDFNEVVKNINTYVRMFAAPSILLFKNSIASVKAYGFL